MLEGPGYYAGADLTASLGLLSEGPVTWKEFLAEQGQFALKISPETEGLRRE